MFDFLGRVSKGFSHLGSTIKEGVQYLSGHLNNANTHLKTFADVIGNIASANGFHDVANIANNISDFSINVDKGLKFADEASNRLEKRAINTASQIQNVHNSLSNHHKRFMNVLGKK